eukprot:CAMPEP_0206445840 /NCGR_PEP_ID=MMETSP0324_2-20121206/15766_1 /ASSEMBLY_ACC=CAM_ASM_000836 /TAXON_ID=2866 /ORGANISM="Crypthecodinium cohnii, Strain Seligo" /LENGTH=511 /DNA_ID=CAMNT_0053914169 /DNA_START=77 /DNA_END=1612 /DNA_ORIENTATION=+
MATAVATGAAPGFGAPTIEVLLKQRAEWMDGLGEGCLLRSEDLSSQSSEWDGEEKDDPDEDEERREKEKAEAEKQAAAANADPSSNPIDVAPLNFAENQKFFASAVFDWEEEEDMGNMPLVTIDAAGGNSGMTRRGSMNSSYSASSKYTSRTNEPFARKLARIRSEIEAFCSWTESHKALSAKAESTGQSAAIQEADMLSDEMATISGLFHQASEAHVLGTEANCKRVWLPPTEAEGVDLVQHLVDLNRFSGHHEGGAGHSQQTVDYKFSAKMGKEGGWLAAAENEVLHQLEGRLAEIGKMLGKGGSDSAAATLTKLSKRLDTLQLVQDPAACDRLTSTCRLLSADIEIAITEAQHLEQVEADAGPDLNDEDTLPKQIGCLHETLSPFDAVAKRVGEIGKLLSSQEETYDELANFSRDLSGAEAQAEHAAELLRSAGEAAKEMKESAQKNQAMLQANIKVLEKKLAEWQDRVAKAEAAKQEAAAAALAEAQADEDTTKGSKKEEKAKKEKA